MNKLPLLLIVPAVAAVGALAVWNLQLQGQLDDLRTATVESAAPSKDDAAAVERTARSVERSQARVRDLENRLAALEARSFDAPAAVKARATAPGDTAASEALDAEVASELADADVTASFRAKVYAVLEERDAARRLERRAREAARITQGMLRGLEVPEDQQAAVEATMMDYLAKRAELRENEDLVPEDRKALQAEMDAARDATLEGILGAESFASVQQRRNQVNRRAGRTRNNPRGQAGGRRRNRDVGGGE